MKFAISCGGCKVQAELGKRIQGFVSPAWQEELETEKHLSWFIEIPGTSSPATKEPSDIFRTFSEILDKLHHLLKTFMDKLHHIFKLFKDKLGYLSQTFHGL